MCSFGLEVIIAIRLAFRYSCEFNVLKKNNTFLREMKNNYGGWSQTHRWQSNANVRSLYNQRCINYDIKQHSSKIVLKYIILKVDYWIFESVGKRIQMFVFCLKKKTYIILYIFKWRTISYFFNIVYLYTQKYYWKYLCSTFKHTTIIWVLISLFSIV